MSKKSWLNTSQTSPGFVYFNTSATSSEQSVYDTTDFMSFGESNLQSQNFNPPRYSSPVKYNNSRYNNQKKWKNNRYSSPGGYQQNNWHSRNSSFHEKHNESNISRYLHPSFMENPWANLEANLKKNLQQSNDKNEASNAD